MTVEEPFKINVLLSAFGERTCNFTAPKIWGFIACVSLQKKTDPIHCLGLTSDSWGENNAFSCLSIYSAKKRTELKFNGDYLILFYTTLLVWRIKNQPWKDWCYVIYNPRGSPTKKNFLAKAKTHLWSILINTYFYIFALKFL